VSKRRYSIVNLIISVKTYANFYVIKTWIGFNRAIYKITVYFHSTYLYARAASNYLSNGVVSIENRNGTDNKLKRPMYLTGASYS